MVKPKDKKKSPPKKISYKLKNSTLAKVWNSFRILDQGKFILRGTHSQTDKKYGFKSNGFQAIANCTVAAAFTEIFQMPMWNYKIVDKILDIGDKLFVTSLSQVKKKPQDITLQDLVTWFYYEDIKATFNIDGEDIRGSVFYEKENELYLKDAVENYLKERKVGVCLINNRYTSFWKSTGAYYFYSPYDCDANGRVTKYGTSCVLRFLTMSKLVEHMSTDVDKNRNAQFTLVQLKILKVAKVPLEPPETIPVLDVQRKEEELVQQLKKKEEAFVILYQKKLIEKQKEEEKAKEMAELAEPPEEKQKISEIEEMNPSLIKECSVEDIKNMHEKILNKDKIRERVSFALGTSESHTYFNQINEKLGILRGLTYAKSEMAPAMAITCLTMLRMYKSRLWVTDIVNKILVLGQNLYKESKKKFVGDGKFFLKDVVGEFEMFNKKYTTKINMSAVVGRLGSTEEKEPDLKNALQMFFVDNDCGVIQGPVVVAVWQEDGSFYMFDSGERDEQGVAKTRQRDTDDDDDIRNDVRGTACVTWYRNLEHLERTYIRNVEMIRRREKFLLSAVQIEDSSSRPNDWANFLAIAFGKWILRGTFSQNNRIFSKDSRNLQCTANSAMALIYAEMIKMEQWNGNTIDRVLVDGDSYYRMTVKKLKDDGKYSQPNLAVTELLQRYSLQHYVAQLDIIYCVVYGLIHAEDGSETHNLTKGLTAFFTENDLGILTAKNISVAVWRERNSYYYFDPHSRDDNALVTAYGTACVVRVKCLDVLARTFISTLGANPDDQFCISSAFVTFWNKVDEETDRVAQPPLGAYKRLGPQSAILRGSHNEGSARYAFNRNKQTPANDIVALAMTKIYDPTVWTETIVDEILKIGNSLYEEALARIQHNDDFDGQAYINNISTNFKIGVHDMTVTFTSEEQKYTCEDAFFENRILDILKETFEIDKGFVPKLVIFYTEYVYIAMWNTENLFFIFDPRNRDERGDNYDKDVWSAKRDVVTLYSVATSKSAEKRIREEMEDGEEMGEEEHVVVEEMGEEEEKEESDESEVKSGFSDSNDEEVKEKDDHIKYVTELSPSQNDLEGKACVLWFTNIELAVDHIVNNIPPNYLYESEFKVTTIDIDIKIPNKKELPPPEPTEGSVENIQSTEDKVKKMYVGPWHGFNDVEYGVWILRGTLSEFSELFPEINRGKQDACNSASALLIQSTMPMKIWNNDVVDTVLKYGDRLHTYCIQKRYKELTLNKGLTKSEINAVLRSTRISPQEIGKQHCLGDYQFDFEILQDILEGDITSDDSNEQVMSMKKGLETFFANSSQGILKLKDTCFAIWKGEKTYYLFDPNIRGPNGLSATIGTACVLRFLDLESMCNIVLNNVNPDGSNKWILDSVTITRRDFRRESEESKSLADLGATTAFQKISAARAIICGNISQEDDRFKKGRNVQFAPNALVALSMTKIHKTDLWTKEILDQVLIIGDRIFDETVEGFGYGFDVWEETLTLDRVKKNFKIGVHEVVCELLRNKELKGVMNIKDSLIINLRQGLNQFFSEFTHGVIQTKCLTVAIWRDHKRFYVFDPNPRGRFGAYKADGVACLLMFLSSMGIVDHFLINLPPTEKNCNFVITPVETFITTRADAATRSKIVKRSVSPPVKPVPDAKKKKKLLKMKSQRIPTCFVDLKNGNSVLFGSVTISSPMLSLSSRGKQATACCVVAIVRSEIENFKNWKSEIIDGIIVSGDQLYKDSYLHYRPATKTISLANILRTFFIGKYKISIQIYKPCIIGKCTELDLSTGLSNYFLRERTAVLQVSSFVYTIFQKSGQYYLFNPYGGEVDDCFIEGGAYVIRYNDIESVVRKCLSPIDADQQCDSFYLSFVEIKDISG